MVGPLWLMPCEKTFKTYYDPPDDRGLTYKSCDKSIHCSIIITRFKPTNSGYFAPLLKALEPILWKCLALYLLTLWRLYCVTIHNISFCCYKKSLPNSKLYRIGSWSKWQRFPGIICPGHSLAYFAIAPAIFVKKKKK